MRPFLVLVLAHLIGDGLLSTSGVAVAKRSSDLLRQVGSVAVHAGIHGALAFLLVWMLYRHALLAGFLVFLLHFGIDMIRSRFEMSVFGPDRLVLDRGQALAVLARPGSWPGFFENPRHRAWAFINLGDQGAHLISLLLISCFI